jgi:vancomycin resistance protein VanJ
MEELFQRMSQDSGPMIVLGDFNMTSHFESYKRMTQNFKDAFREAGNGLGFTYPNGTRFPVPPIIRLDYIFYNDAFQAVNAQRWGTSGSSDHRPVLAALIMRDSAP